ncbi:putative VQ motif-containing protein [Melia azedarach]|uniref:VQ motif-containing protein n=1 Tax=Melia azedarach TaxID=155640 RepID=A0ACC1XVX6_MELAZ|nr:putative VQ motif-containing protein [Melia azedarach]
MENLGTQGEAGCKPLGTFVQTDTDTFREVVQRLTGPSEADFSMQERAAMKVAGIKRQTSKLHERRQYTRPKLEIVKPPITFKPASSPSKSETPSFVTSPLGTPSTIFSKLSIMEEQNKEEPAISELNSQEEEKAIKERRFYLHPSPWPRPGYTEPELLTLFPLTSPKTSEKA